MFNFFRKHSVICKVRCLSDDAKVPVYMSKEAACADVCIPNDTLLEANSVTKVDLQLAFDIKKGYKIIMYPRSSLLLKKGIIQPVSIIDSDYSGKPVHAIFYNPTNNDNVLLLRHERVAQIECVPAYNCINWDRFNDTRIGGFGSTGVL